MTLKEQIQGELKDAMRQKEAQTLSVLRLLSAAIKNEEIGSGSELDDAGVQKVINKQAKQLHDALKDFKAGGRDDLVKSTEAELAIIEKFLPAQLADDELNSTVKAALDAAGISSKADFGKAMGIGMKAAAGQADGNRVKSVVEALLS